MDSSDESSSDYDVDRFVRPDRIRRTVNDDSADILGNFDDEKRKEVMEKYWNGNGSENEAVNSSDEENANDEMEATNEETAENNDNESNVQTPNTEAKKEKYEITKNELEDLLRGVAKSNKHVLYVTNLNAETTKEDLFRHFETAGKIKNVRMPKRKRCAFVEFTDMAGYQRGFALHNSTLGGRQIKVQYSEAGKKKSANKKNIIKQKNRKLASMRNELKTFTKSGKFYDKNLKKEKAVDAQARKRWRKKPAATKT